MFGVREQARVIPEEAIVPQGGRQFVIKLLQGPNEATRTTQRVEVKVGLRSPGKVEITEGLAPGDTVVRTGQQRIQKDGTVVTVVDLTNGASARPATEKTVANAAPAASATSFAATAAKTASPSGPHPCGTVISQLPASGLVPTSSAAMPEKIPASPAARNPG